MSLECEVGRGRGVQLPNGSSEMQQVLQTKATSQGQPLLLLMDLMPPRAQGKEEDQQQGVWY